MVEPYVLDPKYPLKVKSKLTEKSLERFRRFMAIYLEKGHHIKKGKAATRPDLDHASEVMTPVDPSIQQTSEQTQSTAFNTESHKTKQGSDISMLSSGIKREREESPKGLGARTMGFRGNPRLNAVAWMPIAKCNHY